MQFNSAEFLLFFPAVLVTYFALPHRWRWGLLLAASYAFYMAWQAEYVLLLCVSTVTNYGIAWWLTVVARPLLRRLLLVASLIVNLGLLFIFKYLGFFALATQDLLQFFNMPYTVPLMHLVLPVGISFYTFQTMSYTIDVYRGVQPVERHLGIFALYIAFFPQLVAGPIERSIHLLPQFRARHEFEYDRVVSGLQRMAWGFFKKIVIADKAALIVNAVYHNPAEQSGVILLAATYLFAFQIYCDFSGYSDIAIGAARCLGFDLMENFRQPYLAQSLGEFWRCWHRSLSTWFRDYLYIPLGGNRVSRGRHYANLLIVFVVSGLWHGANWTFIIWGALHGLYLVLELLLAKPGAWLVRRLHLTDWPRVLTVARTLLTFHLVLLAWVFFRARSLGDALTILARIGRMFSQPWLADLMRQPSIVGYWGAVVLAFSILLMTALEYLRQVNRLQLPVRSRWGRWASYYALIMLIVLFGELNARGQFIYFQF